MGKSGTVFLVLMRNRAADRTGAGCIFKRRFCYEKGHVDKIKPERGAANGADDTGTG